MLLADSYGKEIVEWQPSGEDKGNARQEILHKLNDLTDPERAGFLYHFDTLIFFCHPLNRQNGLLANKYKTVFTV